MKKLLLLAILMLALVITAVACTETPSESDTTAADTTTTVEAPTEEETTVAASDEETTVAEDPTVESDTDKEPNTTQEPDTSKEPDTTEEPDDDPILPDGQFVQNGLQAWYNASSAGEGVWSDLIGDNDLPVTVNDHNYFTEDGLRVTGGDTTIHLFPQSIVDLVNGNAFTVEIKLGEFISVGSAYNTFMNSENDNFALFRTVSVDQLYLKWAGRPAPERPVVNDALNVLNNGMVTITFEVNGSVCIYMDGELASEVPCTYNMGANNLFIGQKDSLKTFDTTYESIRFYDRALSAVEVKHNAEVEAADSATPDEPALLSTNKTTYTVGEAILVTAVGSGTDWVGIAPKDATESLRWWYIDPVDGYISVGSGVEFDMQGEANYNHTDDTAETTAITAGEYVIYLIPNNGNMVSTTPLASIEITVTE